VIRLFSPTAWLREREGFVEVPEVLERTPTSTSISTRRFRICIAVAECKSVSDSIVLVANIKTGNRYRDYDAWHLTFVFWTPDARRPRGWMVVTCRLPLSSLSGGALNKSSFKSMGTQVGVTSGSSI
jgi:hypothetical protein